MSSSNKDLITEDVGPQIIIISSVFIGLATLAAIGRFCARKLKKVHFGADDWATLLALIIVWVLFAIVVKSIQLGIGRHLQIVNPDNVEMLRKLLYVAQIFYGLDIMFVKCSLLLLYRRVFIQKTFIRVANVLGFFILLWTVLFTLIAIFSCNPVQAFWTGNGWCHSFRGEAIGYAVINIITDLVIWTMPLPMVWQLHLPFGQKVGLSFVFLLGLFDTGAVVARLVLALLTVADPDFTWYDASSYQWSIIEISTGIICSCLPTIRLVLIALVPKFTQRLFAYLSRKSHQTSSDATWPVHSTYNEISHLSKQSSKVTRSLQSDDIALTSIRDSKSRGGQPGIKVDQTFDIRSEPRHVEGT